MIIKIGHCLFVSFFLSYIRLNPVIPQPRLTRESCLHLFHDDTCVIDSMYGYSLIIQLLIPNILSPKPRIQWFMSFVVEENQLQR